LTLVKTAILIAPFIIILILISKRIKNQDEIVKKEKSNKQFKIFGSLLILLFITFSFNLNQLIDIINSYGNIGFSLINNSLGTIFGINSNGSVTIDSSTLTRVNNLKFVKDLFYNHPIFFIFGNGYRYFYVDVPIVEIFLNFGIIGLILYILWHFLLYFFSIRNIISTNDSFQLFLSVYILSTFISLFTQGRPLEYGTYIHAAFFIRFLYTNHLKKI
jgi:hypothetical protein